MLLATAKKVLETIFHMFAIDMAIDVSGSPKEDNFFGLFSVASQKRPKMVADFYSTFPILRRSRWKGTKLGPTQLLKLMKFFDKYKIHIYTTSFSNKDWKKYREEFKGKSLFNERIHAIMYYKLIKAACFRGLKKEEQIYEISLDEETNIAMDPLIDTCIRLCKGGRINVSFNKTRAKYSQMIKFADYAAAACRKVNKKDLDKLEYFEIVKNKIQYREANKAFRLDKKKNIKKVRKIMGNAPHRLGQTCEAD